MGRIVPFGIIDTDQESSNDGNGNSQAQPTPVDRAEANEELTPAYDERSRQATLIIRLFRDDGFFHSPEGETFVQVNIVDIVGGHSETFPIFGREFKSLISHRYYQRFSLAPNPQAVSEAQQTMSGHALHAAPEIPVYHRVASEDGKYYLDLGSDIWDAIEITKEGWNVIANPPVRFRRSPGSLAIPYPQPGGSIDLLREFINVHLEDFPLIVGFLLAALRPVGPYPILNLSGEQGTAKTTISRVLSLLIDPCNAPVRSLSSSERDLMVSATNGHLLCFDNISSIHKKISDALCRLSTGGGFSTRALYTNSEEVVFSGQRPMVLNGITDVLKRGDLRDRAIIVELPPIGNAARRSEEDLWAGFERLRPWILGALLTGVMEGLHRIDSVKLKELPRMADFARWVTACEPAFGWPQGAICQAYKTNMAHSVDDALELDPLAQTIIALAEKGPWQGTASDLSRDLQTVAGRVAPFLEGKGQSKDPKSLSKALRRLIPSLRHAGVEIDFLPRSAKKRLMSIKKIVIP